MLFPLKPPRRTKLPQCLLTQGPTVLVVALKSPDNFQAIDNLRLLLNFDAVAVIADAEAIDQVISKHYANQAAGTSNIDFGSEELSALEGRGDSVDLEDLVQAAGSSRGRPSDQHGFDAGHSRQGFRHPLGAF